MIPCEPVESTTPLVGLPVMMKMNSFCGHTEYRSLICYIHTFLIVWLFLELCKFEALTWKIFFSGWISASDFLGFVSFFKLVDPTGLVQRQGCCAGDPISTVLEGVRFVVFGHMTSILILLISQKVGSLGPNLNPYHGGCLFKWLPRSWMEDMVTWFEAYWQLQWPVAGVHWQVQYLFAATFWFLLHQRDGSLSGEPSCSRWFYHNNSRMRRLWLY